MRSSRLFGVFTICIVVLPCTSLAKEVKVRPRLDVGMEYYDVKLDSTFRTTGPNSSVSAEDVSFFELDADDIGWIICNCRSVLW